MIPIFCNFLVDSIGQLGLKVLYLLHTLLNSIAKYFHGIHLCLKDPLLLLHFQFEIVHVAVDSIEVVFSPLLFLLHFLVERGQSMKALSDVRVQTQCLIYSRLLSSNLALCIVS